MDSLPPGTDPSTVPLALNPNGDAPNFVDPPSLAPTLLAVGSALIVISGPLVLTRIVVNLKAVGKLGIDDYFCASAEILAIGYWAVMYTFAQSAGRHAWDVPISVVMSESFMQKGAAQQVIAGPMFWTSKAAILLFYVRIFGTLRWLRITSYAIVGATFCVYMSNVIVACVYCFPNHGQSWSSATFAKCSRSAPSAVVLGVLGVMADILIFVLPFPVIMRLQLKRQRRIGLLIVFSMGFLVVIASGVSLFYRVEAYRQHDPLWNSMKAVITAAAEVFGTIIVSCTPALSSFWNNFFAKSKIYSSIRARILSRTSLTKSSRNGAIRFVEYKTEFNSSSRLKQDSDRGEIGYALDGPGISQT